ncbi:tRNA pseudouridine65 synthase [Pedobacter psychrotolerans]|uniref:tRNA pseudouridine synthase C n=1 Tax=Pedobacter psychrotolerans TaxID=1843235 RepID=A0A4R2H7S4_9SPHI|nr:pseudouridine synthase [Pedobacter psychrotolerans]TCO22434.1 tRNA pseudouridine65 synthase [Pedobacter psychrotolerans]GGE64560.1 tRNA pseudouridine synthase C [Pedobacter psychrotolerans]
MLEIIYEDDYLIAINKPHGLLVHQSSIARDATEFALQMLRDQVGRHVSPVHRLDRKTSGILLFAFDKDTEIAMHQQFMNIQTIKKYLAILRGFAPDAMDIDYPLAKENGTMQEAYTSFKTLQHAEIAIPFGKHSTSRYSLVEATPKTGRMHQLRRHFSHILHPIIGDRTHGCNKQNKFFLEQWNMSTMLLHASELSFSHPVTAAPIHLKANLHDEFKRVMNFMNIKI